MKKWDFVTNGTETDVIVNEKGEVLAYLDIMNDDYSKEIKKIVELANWSYQVAKMINE